MLILTCFGDVPDPLGWLVATFFSDSEETNP